MNAEPNRVPERGFYYHYKHNPSGEFNNYAYEVCGVTKDSETDGFGVLYRPLYDSTYLGSADYFVRPLDMFLEHVVVDGVERPRFERITDPTLLAKLVVIKEEMYG